MQTVKKSFSARASLNKWTLAAGAVMVAQISMAVEDPSRPPASAHFEILFMEDMIEHHAMAVHMSEMCLAKATRPSLRRLCQKMNISQKREISAMQSWLSSWYRIPSHPHRMSDEEREHMQHLQALPSDKFEQRFMLHMVPHHVSAIKESAQCLQRAVHSELIDLCGDIASSQAEEVKSMRSWLCQWYGICWLKPGMM